MGTLDTLAESALKAVLDWAYDRALAPGGHACAGSLIRWQAGQTAATSFVTALGGFATLPLTLSVDVAGSLGTEETVSTAVMTRLAAKRWLARVGRLRGRQLGKLVPVLGGAVNGTLNGVMTWKVGQRAMDRSMPVVP